MSQTGRYSRRPAAEIEAKLEAFCRDEDLPEDDDAPVYDPWSEDTAVESPRAMEQARQSRLPPKRSGEFLIHLEDEFRNRLEDEQRLAANERRKG